jgi:hypothetical protein
MIQRVLFVLIPNSEAVCACSNFPTFGTLSQLNLDAIDSDTHQVLKNGMLIYRSLQDEGHDMTLISKTANADIFCVCICIEQFVCELQQRVDLERCNSQITDLQLRMIVFIFGVHVCVMQVCTKLCVTYSATLSRLAGSRWKPIWQASLKQPRPGKIGNVGWS